MGNTMLTLLDRYLVWFTTGIVMLVWLVAEIVGHSLSSGAQAAMGSFVAMAALKSKTDSKWRALEADRQETKALIEALDKSTPGSPEAVVLRRELVTKAQKILEGD